MRKQLCWGGYKIMAERRMFAKTIIDSDAFLDMPLSAQCLYFHLSMRADDDGFLNNAKKIMRTINANQNDYDLLVAKSFIIQFNDGICVIKHWRINNYLRSDRYKATIYQEQKAMLEIKDNGRYSLIKEDGIPLGIPKVHRLETQDSIGKNSIVKDSIGKDNINNPPYPPLEGGEGDPSKYDFDKHTNLENAKYVLNYKHFSEWEYILNAPGLWDAIKDWMEYKDAKKPKTRNHYTNIKSLCNWLSRVVNTSNDCGTDAVIKAIEDSIGEGYVGVLWNSIKKKESSKRTDWSNIH